MFPGFNCHRFTKQTVLPVDDVPLCMYCDHDKLFLATERSRIKVFDLTSDPPTLLAQLQTLGQVVNIVYSDQGAFIATVEKRGDVKTVQAYLGWEKADVSQAANISVAGYMTSHRCEGNCICALSNGNSHIQIIEIPLKGEVTAFSLNRTSGNIIVAVGKHVLVYGLSCKIAASTEKVYRELKCLLDLHFSFAVHYIDYYADFVLCASHKECQLVQLNMPNIADDSTEEVRVVNEENNCPDTEQEVSATDTYSGALQLFINWIENPSLNEQNRNYLVKESNFIEWDFAEDILLNCSMTEAGRLKQMPKNIVFPSLCNIKREEQTNQSQQIVILGPDSTNNMPEVVVEYEDTCHVKRKLNNLVQRGTTSYLYCYYLPGSTSYFISPVLSPVSLYKEPQSMSMYCVINAARESRVYKLLPHQKCCLFAVYSYDCDVKQVYVDNSLLYAISSSGLNIYTCNMIADGIKHNKQLLRKYKVPKGFPQEPCLVGSMSFIGLHSMSPSPTKLMLMSKMPCPCGRPDESCWSLYMLQKPTIDELHKDITALLVSYQYMKPASYGHLLYIDYMLLICHVYINGTSHSVEQFICDAALALGLHFARHFPSEADECLSFLRQSSYSPLAVLKHYFDMQLKNSNEGFDLPPPGIIRYLDQTLLNPSADIQWQISQKDDENMISFYKTWSPARLMYLVLTNKLSKESYAAVCDTLLTKKQLEDDRLLSMYTLTRLAVEEDPTLLNRIIKKLQQGHLRQILLFIPECLFCDAKLSPLGVILLTHIPDVVNDVLTSFIKQKHKCVENLVSSVKADTTAVDIHMKQQHTCPESL